MQKSQIKILIIEDDQTLGRAIETALQRAGYTTQLVTNYAAAKAAFALNNFYGIVSDCMLPSKSGIDVVVELNQTASQPPVTIMTSGIFRDKAFAQDAKHRTKARNFLFKPFDIEDLVKEFDEAFSSEIEILKDPIFELLKVKLFSTQDKLNALAQTPSFHGYDLPFIYSLLMDHNICGELEIQYDEKRKSMIEFNHGKITNVVHADTESYFGILLVERGFCTHEDVNFYLSVDPQKKIGTKLVEASAISPHAIQVVQHDQMVIRISKTIQDTSVQLKFTESDKREPAVYIDGLEFTHLLSDWILSKVTDDWFEKFYAHWHDNALLEGADFSRASLLQSIPVLKPFVNTLMNGNWPHSIADALKNAPGQQAHLLRAVHFLLLQRVFVLEAKKSSKIDFDEQLSRIKKIRETIASQNYFEIFNLNNKSRISEFTKAYHNLAKTLHPDKVDPTAPDALKNMTHEVFARITEAYQVLINDVRRKEYETTLQLGQAQDVLKAESAFDDGFNLLERARFRDARKTFEKCMRMKGHRSDTMIYLIWALIREKKSTVIHEELAEKVNQLFNQVPHEDRHSPQYFFVKGLQFELMKEAQRAYSHFKHAYTMDPGFLEAKKEMAFIKRMYGQQKTSIADDLSHVVTKFFKNRTG